LRKGKKKNVMVYLDPKVVKEARELGLNISKVCENALKEAIRRLKGENPKTNPNILHSHMSEGSSSGYRKAMWWAGIALNPRLNPRVRGGLTLEL